MEKFMKEIFLKVTEQEKGNLLGKNQEMFMKEIL